MLLAGVFIMLSILTKAFSALLLPLMIAYVLSERHLCVGERLRNLGTAVLGGLIVFLAVYIMPLLSGEFSDSLWFLTSRSDSYASGGGFSMTSISFNNIFFFMPVAIAIVVLACAAMCLSKKDRDRTFLIMTVIITSVMFCFPFVSYTPTYGIVLTLPVILLYVLNGRIAFVPWALTAVFVLHGIAHYWETFFYPLAAFTGLLDVADVVESMGNGTVYGTIQLLMSSAGFVIMVIMLVYYVIPFIKEYRDREVVADGN